MLNTKLGYRLYNYVGYYFKFLSSNPCISHPNESYTQSTEKMRNNLEHEIQY